MHMIERENEWEAVVRGHECFPRQVQKYPIPNAYMRQNMNFNKYYV